MKSKNVKVGKVYWVKVSGRMAEVRLTAESPYGGWVGENTRTGRSVRIKTAARLRSPVDDAVRLLNGSKV